MGERSAESREKMEEDTCSQPHGAESSGSLHQNVGEGALAEATQLEVVEDALNKKPTLEGMAFLVVEFHCSGRGREIYVWRRVLRVPPWANEALIFQLVLTAQGQHSYPARERTLTLHKHFSFWGSEVSHVNGGVLSRGDWGTPVL